MGFVKVELPFNAMECGDCMFEDSIGFEQDNYCELYARYKESRKRCDKCIEGELREI